MAELTEDLKPRTGRGGRATAGAAAKAGEVAWDLSSGSSKNEFLAGQQVSFLIDQGIFPDVDTPGVDEPSVQSLVNIGQINAAIKSKTPINGVIGILYLQKPYEDTVILNLGLEFADRIIWVPFSKELIKLPPNGGCKFYLSSTESGKEYVSFGKAGSLSAGGKTTRIA